MRLPLTVIGGYLGAGKTTLINRLLAEDHGARLLIMVNDFGAINIDAALISRQTEDMVELSNGCVCCTMGADLFMAIGDVLDRAERPDHLIIEASGIADPASIAQVALAEPDLSYGGIVTVVDAFAYDGLSRDPQIGVQLRGQVEVADLVVVTKGAVPAALGPRDVPVIEAAQSGPLAPLLLGVIGQGPRAGAMRHPDYVSWQGSGRVLERRDWMALLDQRPSGILRLKGFLASPDPRRGFEVHVVGGQQSLKPAGAVAKTQIIAIGLRGRLSRGGLDRWWAD